MSGTITNIDKARQALEQASTLDDILQIRDKAEAIRCYVKAQKQSLEVQNRAAEIKLRAERKAGELLATMEKQKGGRPEKTGDSVSPVSETKLADIGVTKKQSSRWQREAALPEADFVALIQTCNQAGEELTQAAVLRAAQPTHVSQNSCENEWYTPPQYVEAARSAMGAIDVDPASSVVAQQTVNAAMWYGIDDDGLSKEWKGRVWLNPPYSKDLIGRFVAKLKESVADGVTTQAVLLVNNATDTAWFHDIAGSVSAACFIRGRISFHDSSGKPANKPLQGQMALYLGNQPESFCRAFSGFGAVFGGVGVEAGAVKVTAITPSLPSRFAAVVALWKQIEDAMAEADKSERLRIRFWLSDRLDDVTSSEQKDGDA